MLIDTAANPNAKATRPRPMDHALRIDAMRLAVAMVQDGRETWRPEWTHLLGCDFEGSQAELARIKESPRRQCGDVLQFPPR